MAERTHQGFDALLEEAEQHPTRGWDFSWLGARIKAERLPWDFTALVVERARKAASMLDMGTGGGEWLANLPARARRTVATEGWAPNVPVARERLAPLGIEVVQVDGAPDNAEQTGNDSGGTLPFEDSSFDLIINRHESFVAREVARVLRDGGAFLTEQMGDRVYREFHELLGVEPPERPPWRLPLAIDQVEQAGLMVTRSGQGEETLKFGDVGAIVWYIRMVPWTVPDFSIEKYRPRLKDIHDRIEHSGPIYVRLSGFFFEAKRASTERPE